MKYLLDTHAVIWYFENSSELPKKTAEVVDNPENDIYICSASLWEIAIKTSLCKLDLTVPFGELLDIIERTDFNVLQVENEHLKKLSSLPFIHRDPFDRLIIATALAEDLTIITIDEDVKKYDVTCVW